MIAAAAAPEINMWHLWMRKVSKNFLVPELKIKYGTPPPQKKKKTVKKHENWEFDCCTGDAMPEAIKEISTCRVIQTDSLFNHDINNSLPLHNAETWTSVE